MDGIRFLADYPALESARYGRNILIFHSSIGEPAVFDFLESRPERIVVRYHNITPPETFERFDPAFSRILAEGLREIARLQQRTVLALAVSRFNATALDQLGYSDVRVVPLVVDVGRLLEIPPQPPPGRPLPPAGDGTVIAFVGRVSPNKGHHALVKALHVLQGYRHPDAQLWCVGGKAHGRYRATLDRFIEGLGLTNVVFTGPVDDAQLAAIYGRADIYLSLSAHEGFCVPPLEAMAFGVPVVTWGTTAVTETVGDAALVLDSPGAAIVAEAVGAVIDDQDLRAELTARGRRRVEHFAPAVAEAAFLAALLEVV